MTADPEMRTEVHLSASPPTREDPATAALLRAVARAADHANISHPDALSIIGRANALADSILGDTR